MKKFKLDPIVKAKWVTALRSGRYRQGQGFLNCGGKYCCLGVAVEEGLTKPHQVDKTMASAWFVDHKFLPDGHQRILATFNDGHRPKSFKWIAAVIEKYL